jgi:hypothetical protein
MAWIKRNLFFVIGGVIALGLLGSAGFYIYKGWSRNSAAFDSLNEVVGQLKDLTLKTPSPGNEKVNNIEIAKEQEHELVDWMTQAGAYFQPIPAIPADASVDGATYSSALQTTIEQLQHEADAAGVVLPQKFEFSFTEEKDRVTFSPAGLNPLAVQLGEVKALSEVLFAARINAIESIQRVRVSDDDAGGPQADYNDKQATTNELAVITPYVISIRCFTPELSRVLAGFSTSSSSFIVRSVNIQRADEASSSAMAGPGGGMQPGMMPGMPPGGMPAPMEQTVSGKGGLPTVLKEQLLRITLEVDLVKLLPKT